MITLKRRVENSKWKELEKGQWSIETYKEKWDGEFPPLSLFLDSSLSLFQFFIPTQSFNQVNTIFRFKKYSYFWPLISYSWKMIWHYWQIRNNSSQSYQILSFYVSIKKRGNGKRPKLKYIKQNIHLKKIYMNISSVCLLIYTFLLMEIEK